jgi:hypothetical protein
VAGAADNESDPPPSRTGSLCVPMRPYPSSTSVRERPLQQMSADRDPMPSIVRVGLVVSAVVAIYALAVVLLVSP